MKKTSYENFLSSGLRSIVASPMVFQGRGNGVIGNNVNDEDKLLAASLAIERSQNEMIHVTERYCERYCRGYQLCMYNAYRPCCDPVLRMCLVSFTESE
uniref:Uncharacterized protein n=1 Tax=Romanomermis culicivorax TaxID=13658 RepID=A0A915L6A4_ROMCU